MDSTRFREFRTVARTFAGPNRAYNYCQSVYGVFSASLAAITSLRLHSQRISPNIYKLKSGVALVTTYRFAI